MKVKLDARPRRDHPWPLLVAEDLAKVGTFVAVDYPEREDSYYEAGVAVARVMKVERYRMQITFVNEDGTLETTWLERNPRKPDRWKDRQFFAIVTVSEATDERKQSALQRLSPERRERLMAGVLAA